MGPAGVIVELLGPPGAGKTALLQSATAAVSEWADREAVPADAAIERVLKRMGSARLLARVFGWRGRRLRALLIDVPYAVVVLGSNPRLAAVVLGAIVRAPVRWSHRWTLFTRWVGAAARQRFLRRHVGEMAVVFDEGLYHRAVNLFAWQALGDHGARREHRDLARYLRLTPAPDLAIFVDAPDESTRERVLARGVPIRLRGRTPAEVAAFLAAAGRIVRLIPEVAVDARWVRVDNTFTIAAAAEHMATGLRAVPHGRTEEALTWPVEPRALRVIRRPDRRWEARPRALDRAQLQDLSSVTESLQLGEIHRAHSVGAGRSWAVVVETATARAVVKRYKDTVDDEAIRSEHAVLHRLAELRLPAPRLLAGPGGTTLVRRPEGRYSAYHHVAGHVSAHEIVGLPSDGRRRTSDAGRALGLLHRAIADMRPAAWPITGLDADGRRVDLPATHAARLTRAADLGAAGLGERLLALEETLDAAALSTTIIHGDYGPYNVLVRRGCPLFVIDFELARLDWRLADLVTALPRFAIGRAGVSAARSEAFVQGYLSVVPEMRAELRWGASVLEFLTLRRASVCIGRHEAGGAPRWLAEARSGVREARALATGEHPVPRLLTSTS
ncbi:MAG: phosphotransferase [Candidatus Limnocylindria bacterium]